PYAPCTRDGLRARGYDYWAFGHIHQRQLLLDEPGGPIATFSGNLQGRHVRETGAKGCWLVSVPDGGDRRPEVRFVPLDGFRWERCDLDATGAEDGDEVVERFGRRLDELLAASEGRPLAVRVRVHGRCPAHDRVAARPLHWAQELRARSLSAG